MNEEERNELFETTGINAQASQQAQQAAATQYYLEEQNKTLAEAQLEAEKIMANIYHRLNQDEYKPDANGIFQWKEISDKSKRTLTDDGINKIMEVMSWFVNKENLLSNFTEEQINEIMLTFRLSFSANILMRYKVYFREPSFEECRRILNEKIKEQGKVKQYAYEIAGNKKSDKEIENEMLSEIEGRVEYEIEKIRERKLKENLAEFEMLFESLSQIVFATLRRAYHGEERGSLRRHTNISEINSYGGHPPQRQGLSGFGFGRK